MQIQFDMGDGEWLEKGLFKIGGRVRAARPRLLISALRETPRRCIFDLSSHVREFDKTVLECGFEALDSGFFVSGTWILDSNR